MIARLLNYANIIYILVVFLFLQDVFTNVDISFQPLKTGVYWGIMILSPIMLIFNSFIKINLGKKIALILISIFMLTFIFVIKPINILFASGVWETREVLFRNTIIIEQLNCKFRIGVRWVIIKERLKYYI